jgi:CheY-like chemotaxis protein
MTPTGLFWSKRGEVACADHAPQSDVGRWRAERWRPILEAEMKRLEYRCQHCAGTPIGHGAPKPVPLVLNVDDRPSMLYVRDRILRQHGFIVANADSGQRAIEVARQLKPNIILLDVHLPDADGRDLCFRLKQDPDFAGIPIVLISATLTGNLNLIETIRHTSADGFIREPVDPDALASTLWKVLSSVAA